MRLAYLARLDSHPLITKSVTSFFVLGCGDALSQVAIDRRWDLPRTLRFATIGLLITGPSLHFWYGYLARVLPGTSTRTVLARVAADQLVFSPVFLSVFLSTVALVEHKPFSIKGDLPGIMLQNWLVWVPVQSANFKLVPVHLQVLFNKRVYASASHARLTPLGASFVSVAWNGALSYQMHHRPSSSQYE